MKNQNRKKAENIGCNHFYKKGCHSYLGMQGGVGVLRHSDGKLLADALDLKKMENVSGI